jgi:hypothetical protein
MNAPEYTFFDNALDVDVLYANYKNTTPKPLRKNHFRRAFLSWMQYQLKVDDDQGYDFSEIPGMFKGKSFEQMIHIDLTGVKTPQQEKDEILFMMIKNLSLHMDTSVQNRYYLAVQEQRWRKSQVYDR